MVLSMPSKELPKISLFASSVRPDLYPAFFDSIRYINGPYEVVFAGPLDPDSFDYPVLPEDMLFRYIQTGNIKPAQCYEVARRACEGDLVMWVADDCEFSNGLLDSVYEYWIMTGDIRAVISVKTNEDEKETDLDDHRFFGSNKNTPLMAPLGVMSRTYLDLLGGLDQRYICGQYENDIVMRVLADGGKVYKFEDAVVSIPHLKKHGKTTRFWNWYAQDRKLLENSWVKGGWKLPANICVDVKKRIMFRPIENREVLFARNDRFLPYTDSELLSKSQGPKGEWT